MKNTSVLAATLGLFALLAPTVVNADGDPGSSNSTITVEQPQVELLKDDGAAFCSGTFVSPDYILTAGHCAGAEGVIPTKVRFRDGKTAPVFVAIDMNSDQGTPDLAVLRADVPSDILVKFDKLKCDYNPVIGDQVTARGFPLKIVDTYAEIDGKVVAQPETWFTYKFPVVFMNSDIVPGNSGSEVVLKGTDDIVGVVVAMSGYYPRWNVFVPSLQACAMMLNISEITI